MIPVAFKTYNSSPQSLKSATLFIVYEQLRCVDAEWRPSRKMITILDSQSLKSANLFIF